MTETTEMLSPLTRHAPTSLRQAIENFRTIAAADMLMQGTYVGELENPKREADVCQGHQACAVGAFALACGLDAVKLNRARFDGVPGPYNHVRFGSSAAHWELFRRLPFGEEAFALLNDIAENKLVELEVPRDDSFDDPLERLFESSMFSGDYKLLHDTMTEVADEALARIG